MERPEAASSRRTRVKQIVAGLAGTPHPGRRKWRNRPPRGRRLPVAGRSFSPPNIWVCFSKQSHMTAPVKTEKRCFPVETMCFDVQGWGNQKGCFRKQTQMMQPRQSVLHRLLPCRRTAHSRQHFQAATTLSAPCLWLRLRRAGHSVVPHFSRRRWMVPLVPASEICARFFLSGCGACASLRAICRVNTRTQR